MQFNISIQQLINAARLGRKADAAMHTAAQGAQDIQGVFAIALQHNEQQADTIPAVGEIDIFGGAWTPARRSAELQEHIAAAAEIKALARAVGVDL
jgi:hypothetical protein